VFALFLRADFPQKFIFFDGVVSVIINKAITAFSDDLQAEFLQ